MQGRQQLAVGDVVLDPALEAGYQVLRMRQPQDVGLGGEGAGQGPADFMLSRASWPYWKGSNGCP